MVKNVLTAFENLPVTTATVESLFQDYAGKSQKVQSLEKKGELIRVKRGLYVVSPDVSGKLLSLELIANHLYPPSYVSMSSALRYYGLIPEAVYTTQSVTVKASRCFDTPVGRFTFTQQPREAFSIGSTLVREDGYAFLMATPEKALCDLIANSIWVNLRYLTDAVRYLEEDIRMDIDDFRQMNPAIFEAYAETGKKRNSIRTLIKLLRT